MTPGAALQPDTVRGTSDREMQEIILLTPIGRPAERRRATAPTGAHVFTVGAKHHRDSGKGVKSIHYMCDRDQRIERRKEFSSRYQKVL